MDALDYVLRRVVNVVATVPWISLGMVVGLVNRELGISIMFSWVRFFLKLFRVEVVVQNENSPEDPLTGCVFTLLNQASLLDGPVGVTAIPRPCRGIVNLEYALIPFFGWGMWIFCWVIVRQWHGRAKESLAKAERFLREGGNLWISIEGRRTRDGALSPFKKGPVVLAIQAQARIVPVVIKGTRECLGHGSWKIQPGQVVVRYLEAMPTTGLTYEDRDPLIEKLGAVALQEAGAFYIP